MRYDYDKENGFHVDAYKGGDHRIYVLEGNPKGTKAGPGNVGVDQYTRSLRFMNDRYRTEDQKSMVAAFLAGVI